MKIKLIALLLTGIISLSCTAQNEKNNISNGDSIIEKITINKEALYPETLILDENTGKFITGSFRDGKINEINAQGDTKILLEDSQLNSALGIQIDYKHNRLLVLSSDVCAGINKYSKGAKREASLGIYNLETKKAIHFINLVKLSPETYHHLVNGLTIDESGNTHITNSFSPIINKVNMNAKAKIFIEKEVMLQ